MADSNKPSSVPIYISIILFLCFGYGIYDYIFGFEDNGCEMTYMYEYPQFVRIPLPENITQKYPRYKLYVYGEGSYTEQLRDGKYNGIPVLFIPGNGGSYKQARSLASVAYRRSVDSRLRHQLNVFTVDLGEDLAAVHGRLLRQQTRFVAACLRTVLQLYRRGPAGQPPTSVAVVGHSMGGVVARGLYALPGFDPASVNLLYLLAAPIAEPPLRIDLAMVQYYNWVETFWAARRNTTLAGVSVVSLSGGDRDVQVRPHLTVHPTSDITAVTTAVPGVWLSTDHQCIVWCRQLVLVLARSLFDLVNPDTKQLTADSSTTRRVLKHHFVQRTHGKHFKNAFHPATVPMDPSGEWKQYALRQWTYTAEAVLPPPAAPGRSGAGRLPPPPPSGAGRLPPPPPPTGRPARPERRHQQQQKYYREERRPNSRYKSDYRMDQWQDQRQDQRADRWVATGAEKRPTYRSGTPPALSTVQSPAQPAGETDRPTYLMIGLMNNPLYQRATLHTINLNGRDWLVACVASKIEKAVRMCEEGDNLSSLGQQVPSQLGRRRSVTLDLQQLHKQGYTHVVVIVQPSSEQVTVECDVSRDSDRQLTADVPAFTSFRAFFNKQQLLGETQEGALSYNVSLRALTDPWQAVRVFLRPAADCGLTSQAGLSFHVPWGSQTQHVLTSGIAEVSVAAKLQFPRPANLSSEVLPHVTARLDPSCRYSISMQNSFPELWGQMARYFGALLLPATLSVAMVTLAEQLRAADAGQVLTSHAALARLTPLKLVMPSQLLTSLLGWSVLAARFPPPDLPQLTARGLTCSVLPFLLYFVSMGLVALLSLAAWGAVVVIGGVVHKVAGRLVSRAVGGSEAVAEVAVAGAARFPIILSVGLSALALSSCGEIALGLGLLVCCVKVFQSYEDLLSSGGRPAALKVYTSVTLTLVWLWVTLFHLPCLVVWSKTRSESSQLAEDPSLVAALVMCNSGAVLWRDSALRLDLAGYRPLATVVNTAAVGVYLFGMVNVYRAGWLAAAAVLAVALHQLTAPVREIPDEQQEEEEGQQQADGTSGGDGEAAQLTGPTSDDASADDASDASADDGDDDPDSLDGREEGDGVRRRTPGTGKAADGEH